VRDGPPGLWSPLRHKDFALLWGGFVVSHVGDFVQVLAQSWLVVDLTRSAAKVAAVAFAQALPRFFITLFAGVIVDRVDRRRLLLTTQLLAAAQSAVFLVLLRAGMVTYPVVLALALLLGVFDALNLTARQAVMPSLVPREMVPRAVALQALGVNITQILGPSLGGVILAGFGVQGCLVFNVVTFTVLLGTLFAAKVPSPEGSSGQGFAADLLEGVRYLRARRSLWVPLLTAYALGLLAMPVARLLPLYAREVLRVRASSYGLLAAAGGLGAITASVLVTARASARELPRNIVRTGTALGVGVLAFAWSDNLPWTFAALVLFGGAQMAFRSAVMTVFQTEVPDRLRGRVVSVLGMDFALWSLGGVAVGALGDLLAARHGGPPDAARAWGLHVALSLSGAACLAVMAAARGPMLSTPPAKEA
jgi:MFS family permease